MKHLFVSRKSSKGAIFTCSHRYSDLFTCENDMLSSRVKISCFRAKAHLVFHWCLYNKMAYLVVVTCMCVCNFKIRLTFCFTQISANHCLESMCSWLQPYFSCCCEITASFVIQQLQSSSCVTYPHIMSALQLIQKVRQQFFKGSPLHHFNWNLSEQHVPLEHCMHDFVEPGDQWDTLGSS